jgi:hypothetical protein
MEKQTQLLCDLFAGVPGPDDLIGKAGGRIIEAVMNTTGITPDVLGPIASPREWLARYNIPITEAGPAEMACGEAAAMFRHPTGPGAAGAQVIIPIGYDIDDPKVAWTVWHEIGHAADYIHVRDGRPYHAPQGHYSALHLGIMQQHSEEIINYSRHGAEHRDYKLKPNELWAECVACAVMAPQRMHRDLADAILPDLIKRNLPVSSPKKVEATAQGLAAFDYLRHFMSREQRASVKEGMGGDEQYFFVAKMIELAAIVKSMPKTYETDDARGGKAIAYLHYFAGGQANFYVTDKDIGDKDDPSPGQQHQAFGRSDLFNDGGELGYISLPEIFRSGGELDFHWTPKTLDEIEAKRAARREGMP